MYADIPFDPDFDADNPFRTEIPARFVYDGTGDDDFERAYGHFAEDNYDPDGDFGMEDAGMEFGLFGDC
jgi:hypothetical protein